MPIETFFVLFFGLVFGSFVTCASYRLPLDQDVVKNPSYCPKCNTRLGFRDLWPVLSWCASKGKCRHCSAPVHWRYPLIEIVTAAAFYFIYMRYGLTVPGVALAMMAVALLIMIVADLEHYIIPDQVHIALLPLALVWHYAANTPPLEPLYGFLAGLGLGMLLHHGYRFVRKKEGLGFGDVKFFAVAGLWLTLTPFVPFLFFSGLLGVAMGLLWRALGRGAVFPFGPSLALSLFLCVAYPELPALFWRMGGLLP